MESDRLGVGIALIFRANDEDPSFPSPKILPRRLRQRLLETRSSVSAEEIEAKLKDADLRRQQFYDSLSSKARAKTKGPSLSSPQEDDLSSRVGAKLIAAKQKRLSIIAKAQMRLATADEVRQAAKARVNLRLQKEREKIGIKVASRIQRADTNRLILLKGIRNQIAAKRNRAAECLMQKSIQESRYRESVRSAIHNKRVAAEKKRLAFIEAGRTRSRERIMRVRRVAKSVYCRRETERKRMKEKIEGRLQKATKLRAHYLKQTRSLHNTGRPISRTEQEKVQYFYIVLVRSWRQFLRSKRTTFALATAYQVIDISEKSTDSMSFEQLALLIDSATTLRAGKVLLDRLETRLKLSRVTISIDILLKHVTSSYQRIGEDKSVESIEKGAKSPLILVRYPVRIVLCSYMIRRYPDAIFSRKGHLEIALAASAVKFIQELEFLIKIIVDRPIQNIHEITSPIIKDRKTFRSQLDTFDQAWCSYLRSFVAWKVKDTKFLGDDLERTLSEFELSVVQNHGMSLEAGEGLTHGMNTISKQLKEVQHDSGGVRMACMKDVMSDTLSEVTEASEADSTSFLSGPSVVLSSNAYAQGEKTHSAKGPKKRSLVGRPPYDAILHTGKEMCSPSTIMTPEVQPNYGAALASQNEMLVNEIVHEHRSSFVDAFNSSSDDKTSLQAKVRDTVEKAFWDGVMESMKQAEPDFSWVINLVKEVRDELSEVSPKDWKQDIFYTIDIDNLEQVLRSRRLEMDYLGKILDFALVTLQKLSAPANDEDIRATHHKLHSELAEITQDGGPPNASFSLLVVKGLHFVLQQIQLLKKEISKARMRSLEPLIKGPSGLEYLKNAFGNRYGVSTQAATSLPLTKQWLQSIQADAEREWREHTEAISAVTISNAGSSQHKNLPLTTLRSGGGTPMELKTNISLSNSSGIEQPECSGQKVDIYVRLGLLKLVSRVEGLTLEALPETMKLNLSRLRMLQSQLQKLIVILTSILVLRQTFASESLVINPIVVENMVSKLVEGLYELLDHVDDVGIPEITETVSGLSDEPEHALDPEKLKARKQVMASMLVKSLRAGDPIFTRVSHAVYLASRAAVLGGNNVKGKQIAEEALRRVGASRLLEKVMEVAEVLVTGAVVSCSVHGIWYQELLKNI